MLASNMILISSKVTSSIKAILIYLLSKSLNLTN